MIELKNVSETLWLPLFGKAIESKREDRFISDSKAIEIAEKACTLDPNLSRWWHKLSKELQAIMIWRNNSIDSSVKAFIEENPNATFVNIGAGLCTRYLRINNPNIKWLEFDLPAVKQVWLEFNVETENHQYYTDSIFEDDWIEIIKSQSDGPIMFIAEGLLMYFSKEQVAKLLKKLTLNFPESEFVFEAYSKFVLMKPQPDVKKTSAQRFENPWGIKTGKAFEKWNSNIHHVKDDYLMKHDKAIKRMPLAYRLASVIPVFKKAGKMVHLRFK